MLYTGRAVDPIRLERQARGPDRTLGRGRVHLRAAGTREPD